MRLTLLVVREHEDWLVVVTAYLPHNVEGVSSAKKRERKVGRKKRKKKKIDHHGKKDKRSEATGEITTKT